MIAEYCSWHTVINPDNPLVNIRYALWYKDILSVATVFQMSPESEWLAGKWVSDSYVDMNSSDDLDPMIECAEKDAKYIIAHDRKWLDNHVKEIE